MAGKNHILPLVMVFLVSVVSLANAYPQNSDWLPMVYYYQGNYPYKTLGCQDDDTLCRTLRADRTISQYGCALTSMAILYGSYGFWQIPDEEHHLTSPGPDKYLNPATLNNYLAKSSDPTLALSNFGPALMRGFNSNYDLDWLKTTSNFYYADINFLSNQFNIRPYRYVVPNYDCSPYNMLVKKKEGNDYVVNNSASCFLADWTAPRTMALLDFDLDARNYNPPIMKMEYTDRKNIKHTHFVVVAGYDATYGSNDDGAYRAYNPGINDVTWQSPEPKALIGKTQYGKQDDKGPLYHFDRLVTLYRFTPLWAMDLIDTSRIDLTVHSPVEIQIIDPDRNIIGYDPETGKKYLENPMSLYYADAPVNSLDGEDALGEPVIKLTIIQPRQGNYILNIIGSGDGPYTIDMLLTRTDGRPSLVTSLTGTATPSLYETYRVTYSPTGEASLSQTNQAPVASAGTNQTGEQSYDIILNGSASHDPDGDPLIYTWSFASKPNGSMATLSDTHAVKPTFSPDLPGNYILQLVVNDHFTDSLFSTVSIAVALLKSRISVVPNLSSPLSEGSSVISLDVSNIGRVGVISGIINLSLADPAGSVVSAGTQSFSLGVGGNTIVNIPVNIPPLKYGNYKLIFTQSDETKNGSPVTVAIPNSLAVTFSFGNTIYRVRDQVDLTMNLINTGKFNIENATLAISAPDAGYFVSKNVSINLGQTLPLQYVIPIPANTLAGSHNVSATLTLPSGSSIVQFTKFTLQDSVLVLSLEGTSQFPAGGIVTLVVENQGAVDTTYTTQKIVLTDSKGTVVYQGNAVDAIMAGEKRTLANIQVPVQIASGLVFLEVVLQDTKTGKLSYLNKVLTINGLSTNLFARTDKDIYMNTEAVAAISTLSNGTSNIESGLLDLKVTRYNKPGSGEFALFVQQGDGWTDVPVSIAVAADGSVYATYNREHRIKKFDSNGNLITMWGSWGIGNGQFKSPEDIAAAPDGSVYVVESESNRIQKFDSNGNFIRKWGSYGGGNGQFYYPYGIAVAADGSVYVADTCNLRIQKFDSNGNFITKWGSYGSGDGQFSYPYDISVASDGSVYVADTHNNRIQKFDSNGNFIAKWGSLGAGNDQLNTPSFIAVAADGSVYVVDSYNHRIQKFDSNGNFVKGWINDGFGVATAPDNAVFFVQRVYYNENWHSSIVKMTPFSEGSETLFETNFPITLSANTTQDYSINIGNLNATGKLYLEATLKNSLGQVIADAEYPFYIVNGNTVLSFATDKKIYKPGEAVTISGEVRNLATITASQLGLSVSSQTAGAGSQNLITATVDVPANGSYPFTVTTTASSEGTYTLTGTVSQNAATLVQIADQYEVSAPKVTVSITGPDVTNRNPFTLNAQITNTGKLDVGTQYTVANNAGSIIDSNSLTIQAGQTILLQYTQQIVQDTIYSIVISGDVSQSATRAVLYGEAAKITIGQGASIYPEGPVNTPVTITNTGLVDETLSVTYSLAPAGGTQTKTYFLPVGRSITDTLSFTLTKGSYKITASSLMPTASASSSFTVAKDPEATMATTAGSQGSSGLIPLTVNVANSGYNDLSGAIAVAVMNNDGKAVWRGETQVAGLKVQTAQNYIVNVDTAGILPGAYSTSVTLYNSAGSQLAVNQTQVRVQGPIFEITSVPANPSFTVGAQGTISFGVKNTGTVSGSAGLSVKAADLLSQSAMNTFLPGEEKYYTFNFSVPEDAAPKAYLADYVLTPVLSQGTSGQSTLQIAGVNVGVQASLDKDAYRNGETAVLTLTITKLSQFADGTYLAIIRYGASHDLQTFTLSSQPVTLTFNVPLAEIIGSRIFYGIHFTSGRAVYQESLAVNTMMPDLIATFDVQDGTASVDNNLMATLAYNVVNIGKTASEATTAALYDGETLIGTTPVRALNAGETATLGVSWNVLGKAGDHVLKAVVDPQDMVIEYSEANNYSISNVSIPNVTLFAVTDKDAYKIRQKVYITSTVTNLTSLMTYTGMMVNTTVKDPSGHTVYTGSTAVGVLLPSTATATNTIWSTAGLPVDGVYTINQAVASGTQVLAQSSKTITLLKAPDFTLTTDVVSRKIKQGEKATYTASLTPFDGWNQNVTLSMEGLPAGTTVAFSPENLLVPGQSQAVVISTDTTAIGSNTIYLTAQGLDEGEVVTHTVPLILDVSGFGIESLTPSATVKQLETAVYPMSLVALNGYSGTVNVSITGLPKGVKASFSNEQAGVPESINLTVLTSKYAKPGSYTLAVTGDDGLVKHKLDISLVLQPNPNIAAGIIATPGPGPQNDALVRIFNANRQLIKEFTAFNTEYGATSVSADIDGDGYDEVIISEGPGPKNTATLRAYRRDGTLMAELTTFNTTYGLSLATADLDDDWKDELIVGTGPDPKNIGTLKILKFNGSGFTEVMAQTLYAQATYGITIAAGDVDGDGKPEIITAPGPGPGSPAVVTIWKNAPGGLTALRTFRAFPGDYGVNIATGDIDGDGKAEIVTGSCPDPNNSALVRIYRSDGSLMKEFSPFGAAHSYGVNVSSGDFDYDGKDEIITGLGPGPQNEPRIKMYKGDGTEIGNFLAYPPEMDYGVRVSAGRQGNVQ